MRATGPTLEDAPAPEVAEGPADGRAQRRPARPGLTAERMHRLATALAVLPVVVAGVRAASGGWTLVGDNALLAIRSRDVLTEHNPLLGSWTSASVTAGTDINNPGPLLFDLLALPARLVGGAGGVAAGSVLLNVAAVVVLGVFARRRGGPVAGTAAVAAAAALAWAMGSELLYEPWQPYVLLLPFLCFLVLAWSVALGDPPALPVAGLVASLLLQTHLSYGFLVPLLVLAALGALAVRLVRAHRSGREGWAGGAPDARRLVRAAVLTGVLLLVVWAPPVVEQLGGEGRGNLGRLATAFSEPTESIGAARGARIVANVLAVPPAWARPSFEEAFEAPDEDRPELEDFDLPRLPVAAGALALAGLALGLVLARSWTSRDPVPAGAVLVGATALAGALVTAARAPVGYFGIAAHQYRWLWAIGVFLVLVVVLGLIGRRAREAGSRAVTGALLVVTAAFALLNLPSADLGSSAPAATVPVARQLNAGLGPLEGAGPVLVDLSGSRFGDSYASAVLAELQERDVEFVVEDETFVRQLGPSRRFDGTNAEARLLVRSGGGALEDVEGAELVAGVDGLDEAEEAERVDLRAAVADVIADGRLRLNDEGRRRLEEGELEAAEGKVFGRPADPEAFFGFGGLRGLVDEGVLDLDGADARRFERWAELERRLDEETVGVFIAPLEG